MLNKVLENVSLIYSIMTFGRLFFMRFKKAAVMVLAASLIMTPFTANSSYVSANETTKTQIQGLIFKSDVSEDETAASETKVDSSSVNVSSKTSKTSTSSKETKKKTTTKKKSSKKKYSKADLRLMASIINCEAGSEPYQGKIAVGIVVMNRVSSKAFPNSIKGVIYQRGQFSPVRNGSLKKRLRQYDSKRTGSKQWKSCISAAKKVLQGQKTILYKGRTKNMKSYHFFSVYLSGARMKLGGHRFK